MFTSLKTKYGDDYWQLLLVQADVFQNKNFVHGKILLTQEESSPVWKTNRFPIGISINNVVSD